MCVLFGVSYICVVMYLLSLLLVMFLYKYVVYYKEHQPCYPCFCFRDCTIPMRCFCFAVVVSVFRCICFCLKENALSLCYVCVLCRCGFCCCVCVLFVLLVLCVCDCVLLFVVCFFVFLFLFIVVRVRCWFV